MRRLAAVITVLGVLGLMLVVGRAGRSEDVDELHAHLAAVRIQAEDTALPVGQRERLALEMAATLDRAAQAAPTAEGRRARWTEAIALLDEFRAKNPDHPQAREFLFQAAVYFWARAQSWSQQWELFPKDAAAREGAVHDLEASIDRLRSLAKAVPGGDSNFDQNVRFRLAHALADWAGFAPESSAERRRAEEEALRSLERPFTEATLQGFAGLLRGALLDRVGRYEEARQALTEAFKAAPPPPQAAWLEVLTSVLLHQKKFAEALQSIAKSPADEVVKGRLAVRALLAERAVLPAGERRDEVESRLFGQAKALRASGKPLARLALAELARAIAEPAAGQGPGAWEALAEGWLALGETARAAALEERAAARAAALGQAEQAAALRLRAGGLLFQSGEYAQADRLLSRVADDPAAGASRPKAGLLRCLARGQALALKRPGASRVDYVSALEVQIRDFPHDPSTGEARWLLGRARLESSDRARAETAWAAIPPGDPHWLDAQLALARLHRAQLDDLRIANDRSLSDKALGATREFLASAAGRARSAAERAEIDLELARLDLTPQAGRADEARLICERILRSPGQAAQRDRARSLNLVALACLNRFVEAESEARDEAARARPDELLETARTLDQAVSESRSDLRLRRFGLLMRILLAPLIERPEALTPEQRFEARLRQTRALIFSGDEAGARKSIASWSNKPADSTDRALRDLADTYVRLGAFELALDVERLRMRQSPPGSLRWLEARYGLALAYFRSGKADEARKLIDATSILHPELGGGALRTKFEHLRQRIGTED